MEPTKKSTVSSHMKSMFSVVEQMNAGYEKYFDSKPKTPAVRSECYSNLMSCGGNTSNNTPKLRAEVKTEERIAENQQDIVQQFFPQPDEAEQHEEANKQVQVIVRTGCCKYVVKKEP